MAEMNELLEEAEGQCSALSDELDTAVAAIDSIETRAGALYEDAARGASQVKSRLQALAERMEAAEEALEGARQEAVSDLDALAAQAVDVRTSVTDLLEHVRERLEGLQEQQTRLDTAMSERLDAAGADVEELAGKVEEAQATIARQLEEAGHAVEGLGDSVKTAREALAGKHDDLEKALEQLETTVGERASEWVTGVQALLADQTTGMVDLANRAITEHNEVMEALKRAFAVQAKDRVVSTIHPLRDALDRLTRAADQQGSVLSAKAQEVVARVHSVLPVLESMKGAFEQSSRIS